MAFSIFTTPASPCKILTCVSLESIGALLAVFNSRLIIESDCMKYHMYWLEEMRLKSCLYAVPYSRCNFRGTISANHQISHLEVIFAIVKFANHSMVFVGRLVCAPAAY